MRPQKTRRRHPSNATAPCVDVVLSQDAGVTLWLCVCAPAETRTSLSGPFRAISSVQYAHTFAMLASCAVSVGLVLNTPTPAAMEFRQVVQAPLVAQRIVADSQNTVFPSFMVASLIDDEAEAYQAKVDAINAQVRDRINEPFLQRLSHAAPSSCRLHRKRPSRSARRPRRPRPLLPWRSRRPLRRSRPRRKRRRRPRPRRRRRLRLSPLRRCASLGRPLHRHAGA